MPREIDTYYEPFCGGCSVLYRLLCTPSIKVKRYEASDINKGLIALWNYIKSDPKELFAAYCTMWEEFNKYEDIEWKKEYYYRARDEFNALGEPQDLFFIMRTTTNGMPRYNDKGEFNNSCHFSRDGITPLNLKPILDEWSYVLNKHDVHFVHRSYAEVKPSENDLVYLDPPYFNTKGMYFGTIDFDKYFSWLRSVKCKWMMSFDGIRGETDQTYAVPKDIYLKHEYLDSGNSSFERYLGKGRTEKVFESLYLNFEPIGEKSILTQEELF